MSVLQSILQDRSKFIEEINEGVDLGTKLRELIYISAWCFMIYGAIIGFQHSALQAFSSAIKLPILFLVTTVICMPTLFVFSSFFGVKRSMQQTFCLLALGIATIGIFLVAFAPITLFFIITTRNYEFFKLLNVVVFGIAGSLGVLLFYRVFQFPMAIGKEVKSSSGGFFLLLWLFLFAFVGTQLGWTLRPFFGAPDLPFEWIRKFGGNFYVDVFNSIGNLLRPES